MNSEEEIAAFRKTFLNLPEEVKKREVARLNNIVNGEPFIILEDHERGKVLKFLGVQDLIEYLWKEKQIKTTRSYVYRVLSGRHQYLHGYKIYKQSEEI